LFEKNAIHLQECVRKNAINAKFEMNDYLQSRVLFLARQRQSLCRTSGQLLWEKQAIHSSSLITTDYQYHPLVPSTAMSLTYTDFKKLKTLTEDNKQYTLTYGVDEQRRKSVYSENSVTKQTRYYFGDYEEEISQSGNIRKIHYLPGAVFIQNNGVDSLLYLYTDQLGSLRAITNASGTVLERYAYDPWGMRRNPNDWTQKDTRTSFLLNRGFTMHEHLDAFGVINMNGRVYDPLTSQFLSPDPYIQAPGNWVNYGRYAYALNCPTMYIDPSGEFLGLFMRALSFFGGFFK